MELDEDILAKIFAGRPNRFRLLDAGISAAGWSEGSRLLEVGCNTGDAAAHLAKTGFDVAAIDIERDRIVHAAEAHRDMTGCRFLHADATALPFESGGLDGIFSEAAFSVLPDKPAALAEYRRVLKPGGRVLINDFALRGAVPVVERMSVSAVPCFAGARTMAEYGDIFSAAGFSEVSRREEFFEFAAIFTRLSKAIGVGIHDLGGYMAESFGGERTEGESYFNKAKLTYCQMVFEKP